MSTLTKRDMAFLARIVPHLPPETLHQLIRYRGLEACAELVTAATPAQLTSVLDLDLWRHARPGRDELFDVDRFGEWLEVLADAGDSVAARTVAALDANLVVAGLSRYVRVFDPGIFEPTAQSDDEQTVRHDAMREGDSSDGWNECEIGGYLVRARRPDTWDAIVTLLNALEAEHTTRFHAVMQGCRHLSNSRPEIDGLDDLLLAPEQHLHDVTIEREDRRSRQGYVTPADARAFLEMARRPRHTRADVSQTGSAVVNPIVKAYFRAVEQAPESSIETARSPQPESPEAVLEPLAEAGGPPRLVADRSRPRDCIRSGLVGAAPGGQPVCRGSAHLDAGQRRLRRSRHPERARRAAARAPEGARRRHPVARARRGRGPGDARHD